MSQAPVCLGPVLLSVTLAEQRCDTISPGVYPAFTLLPGEGFCVLHTFCDEASPYFSLRTLEISIILF